MSEKNVYFYSWCMIITFFGSVVLSYSGALLVVPYLFMIFLLFILMSKRNFIISIQTGAGVLLIYQIYLIFVSICNNISLKGGIMVLVRFIILIIVSYYIINKDFNIFLKACFHFSRWYFPLNTISCFVFSNGLINNKKLHYPVYVLGTRNSMGSVIIVFIILNFIYSQLKYGKIKKNVVFLNIIGAVAPLYLWSATTAVGMFLVILFTLAEKCNLIRKLIDKTTMLSIYLIGIVAHYAFEIFRFQKHLSFIIEIVLRKTIKMSARTYIWDKALELISQKKWLGYGIYDNSILDVNYFIPANTHSFFFEVTITGGIVGLIFITLIFIKLSNKKIRPEYVNCFRWIKCYMLTIMIMGISESTNLYYGFFLVVVIGSFMISDKDRVCVKLKL